MMTYYNKVASLDFVLLAQVPHPSCYDNFLIFFRGKSLPIRMYFSHFEVENVKFPERWLSTLCHLEIFFFVFVVVPIAADNICFCNGFR